MTRTMTALVGASLLVTAAMTPAQAETTQECLRATFDVAKGAQGKNPSEDALKSVEAKLTKIEALCDEQKFAEADTERKALADMVAKL